MATILGLDIDPHAVRGVVVKTALRKSQISAYIGVPLPPLLAGEDPEEQVRGAVRQVLASIGQPPDRVVTELSGGEVSIRKVAVPAKAAKRLNEILPHELEGNVPFDPDDSVIDHQTIQSDRLELKLLAAVAPKDRVRKHLARMLALGVDPREVAVGAVALDGLLPLLPRLSTPGPHCLIDIHAEGTDVCIVQNGTCHFARTLSVGIRELDEGKQSLLERELKQTMAAWRMEGGVSPSSFFVCGMMATRQGSDAWLAQILGAPVEVLPLPSAPGADDAGRAAFARAAALAGRSLTRGRHLDARQGEFAAKQTMTALRQHLPLFAGCIAAVVASFVFSSYARYSVLEARNEQLNTELRRVTRQYFGREATSADQAERLLRGGIESDDPMPRFDAWDALSAISSVIPETMTHDVDQLQIDLNDGEEAARFSLRGTVSDAAAPTQIQAALEGYRLVQREGDQETSLQCFRALERGSVDRMGEGYRYRLEGMIACRPEGEGDEEEEEEGRGSRRRRGSQ
jgi:Tfp pilus assembly PilM family ATPase